MNLTGNESAAVTNWTYCNLSDFSRSYRDVHGYLSLVVCLFGSVTNVLNICVLTTREMRWPTNLILTGLAVADLFVMLEYVPFACHFFLDPNARRTSSYFSYGWAVYTVFHASFTQIFHFVSCCLTVLLAVWRYVAINRPQNGRLWSIVSNGQRTIVAVALTYLLCPIVCTPIVLSIRIVRHNKTSYVNGTLMKEATSRNFTGPTRTDAIYLLEPNDSLKLISLWMYGVVIKLVPCLLLTVLSKRLIDALVETKRRRRQLLNNCGVPLVDSAGDNNKKKRHVEKEQQTDRTTRMLLAVLMLFLLTEFPQGMLGLLSILIGDPFWKQCYVPFGDVMDILALTNSAINFVLYCSMSRQFRSAFHELFLKPRIFNRWKPITQHPQETNGGITQVTQL